MEEEYAQEEEQLFEQLPETRILDHRHNNTAGGNRVAWLNAERGKMLGPSRTQEVQEGDSLTLEVDVIFDKKRKGILHPSALIKSGSQTLWKDRLLEGVQNLNFSPEINPMLIYEFTRLLLAEIESKKTPESYLMYALYDQDSVLYDRGKVLVSNAAANEHEQLRQTLKVKKSGYLETFVVNETAQNIFFDNLKVQSTSPIIVQENAYYPFGMTIAGLDYSYNNHTNRYLYNGKELLDDQNLGLYDYGARYFDPVIGRWTSVDPMASEREWLSPYNFVQNNPILRIDPDGMLDEYNFNVDTGEFEWISDKGGDERQYVNVVNNEGDVLGEGSVQGDEVHAYRLRESVVLTNFDAEFDDRSYNRENGYQYSLGDFQLRNEYKKTDNVFGRFIDKAERAGKAVPISLREHEMKYGYLTSRLMMMGTAIESGLMLADPLGKPFSLGGSRYFSRTVGATGSQGAKALTNANTGWNSFLKANTGKYSGAGWQKRAAADYYKSSFYRK